MVTVGSIFPNRGNRPNRICDGNLPPSQRALARYFDTACFVPAAAEFILEDGGVETLRGPSLFNFDALTEGVPAQLQAELFDALNHRNFAAPGTTLGIGNYGVMMS